MNENVPRHMLIPNMNSMILWGIYFGIKGNRSSNWTVFSIVKDPDEGPVTNEVEKSANSATEIAARDAVDSPGAVIPPCDVAGVQV